MLPIAIQDMVFVLGSSCAIVITAPRVPASTALQRFSSSGRGSSACRSSAATAAGAAAAGSSAAAEPVHARDEDLDADFLDERPIPGFLLTRQRQNGDSGVDSQMARRHFFILIVVPRPTTEPTSNSSIRRFAPGRPAPTPCDVE